MWDGVGQGFERDSSCGSKCHITMYMIFQRAGFGSLYLSPTISLLLAKQQPSDYPKKLRVKVLTHLRCSNKTS